MAFSKDAKQIPQAKERCLRHQLLGKCKQSLNADTSHLSGMAATKTASKKSREDAVRELVPLRAEL